VRDMVMRHPKRQISPKMGGTQLSMESRSLSRPPVGGLARDDNIFGSSESVTAGRVNFWHRVRTNDNWDVGRFRRVNFLKVSLDAINCF
jgi:hypothetical protein